MARGGFGGGSEFHRVPRRFREGSARVPRRFGDAWVGSEEGYSIKTQ